MIPPTPPPLPPQRNKTMPDIIMEAPLITHAQQVKEQANRYEHLRSLADQQNRFRGWLDKFREPLARLEAINRIREELGTNGVPLRAVMPVDATREKLQAFLERFRTDPGVLIATQEVKDINDLLNRIKAHVTDRQEKTREDWRVFVKKLIPPIPSEVLDVLGRVPAFRSVVHDIQSALTDLERVAERLPQAREEILQVREKAEKIRNQWEDLGGEGIPEEVLTFLRAAGSMGAPLNSLTDTVRSWLQSNDLENSFAIRMRTTSLA